MFRSMWTDDARLTSGEAPHGQSATGADNIVDMLRRLRAGKDFFIQFAVLGVIEIAGDEATTGPSAMKRRAGQARATTATIASRSTG